MATATASGLKRPSTRGSKLPEAYDKGYGFVPAPLLESPVSLKAKVLFCAYASFAGSRMGGSCYASWDTLGRGLSLKPTALRSARAELVSAGFIKLSGPSRRSRVSIAPSMLPRKGLQGGRVPKRVFLDPDLTLHEKGVFAIVAANCSETNRIPAKLSYSKATAALSIGRSSLSSALRSLIDGGLVERRGDGEYITSTGIEPVAPYALPKELEGPFARLCALSVNKNKLDLAAERYAHWIGRGVSYEAIEKAYKLFAENEREVEGTPDRFFPQLAKWLDPEAPTLNCSRWIEKARRALALRDARAERRAAAAAGSTQTAAGALSADGDRPDATCALTAGETASEELQALRKERAELIASFKANCGRGSDGIAARVKELNAIIAELEKHAQTGPVDEHNQSCGRKKAVLEASHNNEGMNNDSQYGACAPGPGPHVSQDEEGRKPSETGQPASSGQLRPLPCENAGEDETGGEGLRLETRRPHPVPRSPYEELLRLDILCPLAAEPAIDEYGQSADDRPEPAADPLSALVAQSILGAPRLRFDRDFPGPGSRRFAYDIRAASCEPAQERGVSPPARARDADPPPAAAFHLRAAGSNRFNRRKRERERRRRCQISAMTSQGTSRASTEKSATTSSAPAGQNSASRSLPESENQPHRARMRKLQQA